MAKIRATALDLNNRNSLYLLIFGSLLYQALLCFLHTNFFQISTAIVGATELILYIGCILLIVNRLDLRYTTNVFFIVSYVVLLSLLRQNIDFKGIRDLIVIVLFFELGRTYGSLQISEILIKYSVILALTIGAIEILFLNTYSHFMNIYSYYISQGNISQAINWAEGSSLALNAIRPDGIGRTFFSSWLGSHRISSFFLEPVSFGNFAVIVASWALSKETKEVKSTLLYLFAAAIIIILSDSRYGGATVLILILIRLTVPSKYLMAFMMTPVAATAVLLGIALVERTATGDNLLGRLFVSGNILKSFNLAEIFGLEGYQLNFGDGGYASALTHFGLVLCVYLWLILCLMETKSTQEKRFRTFAVVYCSLLLTISGTSFFALKTAGLLWFLIGSQLSQGENSLYVFKNRYKTPNKASA